MFVPSIPKWITIFLFFLGLFGLVIGLVELLWPASILDLDLEVLESESVGRGWGARNFALGLTMLVAVVLRNPYAYIVAFVGALGREAGGLIVTATTDGGASEFVFIVALIVLQAVALVVSSQATRAPDHS